MSEYGRQYRLSHQNEIAAHKHRWYLDHTEERVAYQRQYAIDHPEEKAACQRQWRLDHPGEIAGYGRQWRRDNPDKTRAKNSRRRARLLNAPGWDYTTDEMIAARWEMWGGLCYICGEPATDTDHVKPLSKGGSHYPANLRPVCKQCNSSKSNRWPYPIQAVQA